MNQIVRIGSCLAFFALTGQASVLWFTGSLLGVNENPPNASPGTGTALVSYDTDLHILAVELNWSDLIGTTTVAHIHCCVDPPGNIGVATYPGTFPLFPPGVTSGTYSGSWNLTDPASYPATFVTNFGGGTVEGAEAALVAGLQAGRAYVNLHTSFAPGGEIRDFLAETVPEPGTAFLFASACLAFAVSRMRRKSV